MNIDKGVWAPYEPSPENPWELRKGPITPANIERQLPPSMVINSLWLRSIAVAFWEFDPFRHWRSAIFTTAWPVNTYVFFSKK